MQTFRPDEGPAWYSVIADEAADIVNSEQLNLSICLVHDNYEVREDPVGLFRVPDTKQTIVCIPTALPTACSCMPKM